MMSDDKQKAADRIPQYRADETPAPVEDGEGRVVQADPAAPIDYDSDPAAGGGKVDFEPDRPVPASGADASSHGGR
jgi:hypothetical protein